MKFIDEVYAQLVKEVMAEGTVRQTRNGETVSVFGTSIKYDIANAGLPMISLRKMFTKGVVGEFKGFLQDVKTVQEFRDLGCPYWDLWGDEDGKLELDYPPREQWEDLIEGIKTDPGSRRHMINVWNHSRIEKLSLPCCHFSYQFYVRDGFIDMIWTQRSLDVACGLPSDLILAALYLSEIGRRTGLKPGTMRMNFGDTHIYKEHWVSIMDMVSNRELCTQKIDFDWNGDELTFNNYAPHDRVKFLLKG